MRLVPNSALSASSAADASSNRPSGRWPLRNVTSPRAEHHVQLGEAEDEPLRPVDQDDVVLIAQLVGEPGRQLQTTETGTQHQDSHHRPPSKPARQLCLKRS
jgi:hypothetical protein